MSQTILYIRAQAQRAEQSGERNVSLNIKDVLELLSYADAVAHAERVEHKMKPAGWVCPSSLRNVAVKRKQGTHMHRFKTPMFCLEVFYRGSLADAEAESVRLYAERDAKFKERQARKEASDVQATGA